MKDTGEDSATLAKAFQAASISPDDVSCQPASASLPRTLIKSFSIDNVATDVWIQIFQDRLVFGVSQLQGRIGNFIMCEPMQSLIDVKHVHYEVTNLLGAREQTALNVYAKQLCERIINLRSKGAQLMTIVLGISLDNKKKGNESAVFRTILDVLVKLYEDAMEI